MRDLRFPLIVLLVAALASLGSWIVFRPAPEVWCDQAAEAKAEELTDGSYLVTCFGRVDERQCAIHCFEN